MTDQHRASPADWLLHAASLDDADSSCILELRSRIEALEAAQALDRDDPTPDAAMTELRAASAEARPAKGLVLRVSEANNSPDAIRTVAAWLREGRMLNAAELLEQEANHG